MEARIALKQFAGKSSDASYACNHEVSGLPKVGKSGLEPYNYIYARVLELVDRLR